MKSSLTFLIVFGFLAQNSFAQHIPPTHNHNGTTECYGYATGRAFGKTQWNGGTCPLSNLEFTDIPSEYFETSTYSQEALVAGDIIYWGSHATYLLNAYGNYECDNVNGPGQTPDTVSLASLISEWGTPTSIKRRKKDLWEVRAQNDFGGGKIGYQGAEYNSPYTKYSLDWTSGITAIAVDDGRTYIFKKVFQHWEDDQGTLVSTNLTAFLKVGVNHQTIKTYTAIFLDEYNVTFVNHFVNLSNSGTMKVNGNQYSLPASAFPVLDTHTITAEAIDGQIFNSISYAFSYWSDGDTTYPNRIQTFQPDRDRTYTAHFTGKPVRVQNLHNVASVGSPIQLVWNEHPNSNCTYQIWRKVKELYGTEGDPILLATKPHGTTSYIDNEYVRTNSYTEYLISYDVRAYYTVESTAADPWWYTLYGGDPLWKDPAAGDSVSQYPARFELANYPNPFNPVTTIHFRIPEQADITMVIYNSRGQRVKMLLNEPLSPGDYRIQWNGITDDGRPAASGIYWLRLESKAFTATRKLLLIR